MSRSHAIAVLLSVVDTSTSVAMIVQITVDIRRLLEEFTIPKGYGAASFVVLNIALLVSLDTDRKLMYCVADSSMMQRWCDRPRPCIDYRALLYQVQIQGVSGFALFRGDLTQKGDGGADHVQGDAAVEGCQLKDVTA